MFEISSPLGGGNSDWTLRAWCTPSLKSCSDLRKKLMLSHGSAMSGHQDLVGQVLGEALSNFVKHPKAKKNAKIRVRIVVNSDELTVEVSRDGVKDDSWYDPAYNLSRTFEALSEKDKIDTSVKASDASNGRSSNFGLVVLRGFLTAMQCKDGVLIMKYQEGQPTLMETDLALLFPPT